MAIELFIFVNALLIGALGVLGIQHLRAHRRGRTQPDKPRAAEVRIPRDTRDRLIDEAQGQLVLLLNNSVRALQHDLDDSIGHISGSLEKTFKEIAETERQKFAQSQAALTDAGQSALARFDSETRTDEEALSSQLEQSKKELEAKLAETFEARKAELVARIDQSLSDSVVSFLLESLGHDVDLGAQTPYIIARLEENKELFKAGISR